MQGTGKMSPVAGLFSEVQDEVLTDSVFEAMVRKDGSVRLGDKAGISIGHGLSGSRTLVRVRCSMHSLSAAPQVHLDLSNNNLGTESAVTIADALNANASLRYPYAPAHSVRIGLVVPQGTHTEQQ